MNGIMEQCPACGGDFRWHVRGHEVCETRQQARREILTEIRCRVEHGADSNGHLEGLLSIFAPEQDTKQ